MAGSPWLDRLNSWRASTNLPMLYENTQWSQGDYNHALYMVKNDLITHYETPGVPYYTTAGAIAAQNSNIQVSSTTNTSDVQAIDWWMQAPFHAMGLMDPRLMSTGFGSYREVKSGWQEGAAVDTLRGNSWSGGQYPVYFPGNGASEPLTTYGGGEYPDPLQACPGYSASTGLPVFIEVGGNVATSASAHSFTGNGVALQHCVIDSNSPYVGSGLTGRGGVIVVPRQPLQWGVKYVVALTVNGTPYTWSFTVGNFVHCATASLSPATVTQAVGSVVNLTASSTGCPNPQYAFWVLDPGGTWTFTQGFGGPAFSWNTSGLSAGTYTIHAWANAGGNSYDAIGSATVTLTGCGTAGLSPPVATQPVGTTINFTATSTCTANPRYAYWVLDPSGTWTFVRGFGGPAFAWMTARLAPGTYTVHVWVNTQGNGYDAIGSSTVTLTGCVGTAALSPAGTTQPIGSTINFTASSTCISNPRYAYWVLDPSGTWSFVRNFGGPTFAWMTAGLNPGTYTVHVWVNTQGNYYDAIGSSTVTLTGCGPATLSPSSASQPVGSTVNFTASATCSSSPRYAYWVLYPGGTWYFVRNFGGPTFAWTTAGLAPGTYTVHVWVNTQGNSYDTIGSSTVTLT
jgi:hypothetical protein